MKTVILCGGKGIRIRDLNTELPKPMIPIGNYPIVHHIMDIYSRYGFNEFVLCLGYKSWKFKEYFLNIKQKMSDLTITLNSNEPPQFHGEDKIPDWKITLAETGINSMTGYRILAIREYIGQNTFMLTYGDGVSDIDLQKLLSYHRSHGKLATVTSVHPRSRFGELVVHNQCVTDFQEKPQTSHGLINGGFFVCEPGVFDYIQDDTSCSWEKEPLINLARDGQLMTYIHEGFWMPMDTTREFNILNELWEGKKSPWMVK